MRLTLMSSVDGYVRDRAVDRLTAADEPLDSTGAVTVVGWDVLENGAVTTVLREAGQQPRRRSTVMEHECRRCVVRLVIVPTLLSLIQHRAQEVVACLPPGLESALVLSELFLRLEEGVTSLAVDGEARHVVGPDSVEIASLVLALDPAALEDALWDGRTLSETGVTSLPDEQLTLGEFLIREICMADTVLTGESLTAHLFGDHAPTCQSGGEEFVRGTWLLEQIGHHLRICHPESALRLGSHDLLSSQSRSTPGALCAAAHRSGPFTTAVVRTGLIDMDLLLPVLREMAAGTVWLRGCLWSLQAPHRRMVLTGIGPQVWVEDSGPWEEWGSDAVRHTPSTVLAFTGKDLDSAELQGLLDACASVSAARAAGSTGNDAPHDPSRPTPGEEER